MIVGVAVGVSVTGGGFVDAGSPSIGPTIDTAGSLDVSTFKIGTEHTITAGTASATGGGSVTYEYRWLVAGVSDASTAAYTPLAANDEDTIAAQWRAVETGGTNPGETAWQTVGSGTITYDAAANSVVPTISGSTSLGDTLTATTGTWSGDVGGSYTYQWNRNGSPISGETGTTYTIVVADDAADITWTETYTNSGGATSATSAPTTVDDFAAPANTVLPAISGGTGFGDTLTVTDGTWTADPAISGYSYQWKRNGANIGSDQNTYTIVSADDAATITCDVTATNPIGSATATAVGVTVDDFTLPTWTVSLGAVAAGQTVGKPGSGADVEFTIGGSAGVPDDPLSYDVIVDEGAPTSVDSTPYTASGGEELQARISDADHPAGTFVAVSNLVTVSAVASITALTASNQDATGDVDVTYTISADSTVTGVVTTSATAPTAAQILAGQDHTGAAASDTFTDTWTTAGADSLETIASGIPSGTYYLHVLPAGGADGDVASSNSFTLETVAPTITAAATSTDGTTVTLTVSENVSGTASAGDWAVYDDGVLLDDPGPSVSGVSAISTTTSITLTLAAAVPNGQSVITYDYTPGDIEDAVSNQLAAISGGAVTNNVPVSSGIGGMVIGTDFRVAGEPIGSGAVGSTLMVA